MRARTIILQIVVAAVLVGAFLGLTWWEQSKTFDYWVPQGVQDARMGQDVKVNGITWKVAVSPVARTAKAHNLIYSRPAAETLKIPRPLPADRELLKITITVTAATDQAALEFQAPRDLEVRDAQGTAWRAEAITDIPAAKYDPKKDKLKLGPTGKEIAAGKPFKYLAVAQVPKKAAATMNVALVPFGGPDFHSTLLFRR